MKTAINRRARALSLAVAAASVFGPAISSQAAEKASRQLEEVIVTSTYRDTRLMDTPVAISALTSEDMFNKGIEDVQTLYKSVPGLNYRSQAATYNLLTIRGLTPPASGAAMVGVYMDNLPMTDSSPGGLRQVMGEMFDMERVEVLKGPQGTLYGEGSMGGSIRYITKKPDPSGLDFAVTGKVQDMEQSSGLSNSIDAMANIPLGESLALRVVGFRRDNKGFIDQVAPASKEDVNDLEQIGGRARLTWFATDTLEVSLMANVSNADIGAPVIALHCNTQSTASNPGGQIPLYELPGTTCAPRVDTLFREGNPYVNHSAFPDITNGGTDDLQMYNFTVDWQLPFATLTSSTSYFERESAVASEAGPETQAALRGFAPFPAFFPTFPGNPVNATNGLLNLQAAASDGANYRQSERWAQEFRLVSNTDGPLQWTAGLYYKKEEVQDARKGGCFDGGPPVYATLPDQFCELQYAFAPGTPLADQQDAVRFINFLLDPDLANQYSTFTEQSVFGEVSYRFNEQWELLVGARYAQVKNELDVARPRVNSRSNPTNSLVSETNVLAPKATLTWRPNQDWMVYATVATGFRPGVVNNGAAVKVAALEPLRATNPAAEEAYQRLVGLQGVDSDEVVNYELGAKAAILDNRVSFTAAVYHIDWNDAIVSVQDIIEGVPEIAPIPYTVDLNSGKAESEGLELEVKAMLTESVNLTVGGDWNWKAELLTGGAGRYRGIGFAPGARLTNAPKYSAYASLAWDFTLAGLDATARADGYLTAKKYYELTNDLKTPATKSLDLRLIVGRDTWKASVFVTNVTDEVNAYELNTIGWVFAPPRSVGVQLSYNFK